MKHTPTPWKADDSDICQNNNNHYHVIASVEKWEYIDEITLENKQSTEYGSQYFVELHVPIDGDEESNANYIVDCVDNHQRLIDALKAFSPHKIGCGNSLDHEALTKAWKNAQYAITRAEGN